MFDHSTTLCHILRDFGSAFIGGIILNSLFIIAEIVYGLQANSLALLADAGHNASDVMGLFISWIATMLAKRQPSERYTCEHRQLSSPRWPTPPC